MHIDEQEDKMQVRRRRFVGVAALCLVALCGLGAIGAALPSSAAASPSRYIVEVCDSALPGGATAGVKYTQNPGVAFTGSNTCAQPGGSLSITETGTVEATFALWSVPVAITPGGMIESMAMSGSLCGAQAPTIAFAYERDWPANACIDQLHYFHGSPLYSFWIWLECDGTHGPCGAGPSIYVHYIAATEVDPVAPTLGAPSGSLLLSPVARGHQTIGAEAHDTGGGLSEISVSVNGLPAAQPRLFNCAVAHTENPSVDGIVSAQATPCPTDGSAEWTLDTEAYPFHDGANTVEVCAADFSTIGEPNTTCSAPQAVKVDNSCTASAVSGGEVLSAVFPASGTDSVSVPFDHSAEVAGRLTDNGGDPVPGATLCVKMQTIGVDRESAVVGSVKTDAAGRYSYEVAPGPDREVVVGYRHDAKQLARGVNYYAHAKPTLRLAPPRVHNGDRIRMWGTLPGPQAAGRVVVLQASAVGSKRWLTFRRATSDRHGAFKASYRFNATPRRTVYRIRALVPNQSGYPWLQGQSKPARVLVTG
jgi:hypothetical protein